MPRCIRRSRSTSPSSRRNSTMRVSFRGSGAQRYPRRGSSPSRIAETADNASSQVRSWTAAGRPTSSSATRGHRVRAGDADVDRARRLAPSCGPGPATPVVLTAYVAPVTPPRPVGHRPRALGRDHAVPWRPARAGRPSRSVFSDGGVGHHPADVVSRRARHRRQQRRQPAAGQRLRGRQRRSARRAAGAWTSARASVMPAMLASLAVAASLADMALPIEDYALIGDRHTAALVGPRRLGRLAVPAPVRLPRLLRRAARHRGARPLAALPGRRVRRRPGATSTHSTVLETTFTTDTGDGHAGRPDADRRRPGRPGPPRHRRRGHGADAARVGRPHRLRRGPALGAPAHHRRRARSSPPSPAPTSWCCAAPGSRRPPTAGTSTSSTSSEGDELTFSTTWVPSYVDRAGPGRHRRPDRGHPAGRGGVGLARRARDVPHADVVRRSLLTLRLLTHERDRRHRRRADHLPARGLRRRAQLGLPLLLAARRRAHPRGAARAPATPTRRGSGGTGCCGRSPATPRTCRSCTPSTAPGGCPSATLDHLPGYAGSPAGPDRQRRRRRSARPTCSAR